MALLLDPTKGWSDELGALQVHTFCYIATIIGIEGMRLIIYHPMVSAIC